MAAGQQRKRMSAANSQRISLHDSVRVKKPKRSVSSDILLNMTPHIALEWDESRGKASAKKELVGIKWRDMAPFLDHIPRVKSCLADVAPVPEELFGPENVTNVFSYEVWKTHLTEHERHLLAEFLPSGSDADHAVNSLFSGENIHFGNPFSNWVASLCAGNLHPDKIIHKERQLRACRNAYFADLKKYHSGFIEILTKLKETWEDCGDQDEDMEDRTLRSSETNLENGGSEYMSYIKISKKQHQLLMNVERSDDGIHPSCLSEILGDIRRLNVKSYAVLEEEERERMHEHWLKLAREDLPAAFENRRRRMTERDNMRVSLQDELLAKEERESLTWTTHSEEFAHDQPVYHHFTDCQSLGRISLLGPSHVPVDPSFDRHVERTRPAGPPAWQFLEKASLPQEESMFPPELRLSLTNGARFEEQQLMLLEPDQQGGSRQAHFPADGFSENHSWGGATGSAAQSADAAGSTDGSLFCVLSECNKLFSGFRQTGAGSEQLSHQEGIYLSPGLLDSAGGRDVAGLWMNFPNQRPGFS